MLRKLGTLVVFTVLLLIGVLPVRAADVPIFPSGPVFKFPTPLTFGATGPGGFNNNFFFTPVAVNESVCVYFKPSSLVNLHTFTVSIVVTPDPAEITPSDTFWLSAAQTVLSVGPGFAISGIGANVSGAAQVSINLSNSAAPADTAQVTIIQSSGPCMTGTNFVNNSLQNVNAATFLQTASDGLSQGFFAEDTVTNPAVNTQIIDLFAGNLAKSVYPDRLLIYASAAATININRVTVGGTGCVANTIINLKIANTQTPVATSNSTCATTQPTVVSLLLSIPIPATTVVSIDLRGFILPPNASAPSAINVNMGATLTGTITPTLFWAEK